MFEIREAIEGVSMMGPMKIIIFEDYKHKINLKQLNDQINNVIGW